MFGAPMTQVEHHPRTSLFLLTCGQGCYVSLFDVEYKQCQPLLRGGGTANQLCSFAVPDRWTKRARLHVDILRGTSAIGLLLTDVSWLRLMYARQSHHALGLFYTGPRLSVIWLWKSGNNCICVLFEDMYHCRHIENKHISYCGCWRSGKSRHAGRHPGTTDMVPCLSLPRSEKNKSSRWFLCSKHLCLHHGVLEGTYTAW